MNKKWILVAFIGALLVFVPLWAQQKSWREARHSILVRHLMRDLDLSDSQRAEIKSILQNEQPAIKRLIERHDQLNAQLRSRSSYDEAFVRSVAKQQSEVAADSLVEKEKVRAQIMAVLNPAQQQKVDRFSEELRVAFETRLAHIGDAL